MKGYKRLNYTESPHGEPTQNRRGWTNTVADAAAFLIFDIDEGLLAQGLADYHRRMVE
jgi:hypothetical protein